jgi:hypothetical protein
VGKENFAWIVDAVAELAVKKARTPKPKVPEFHWSAYLGSSAQEPAKEVAKGTSVAKPAAKKETAAKPAAKAAGKSAR